MHTYDTVKIINCCNYCASKAPSLDIAAGQLLSYECDCINQNKTLNLKLEEAKPLFTNIFYCFKHLWKETKILPIKLFLKCFLDENDQTAWGPMLPSGEHLGVPSSSTCSTKYCKTLLFEIEGNTLERAVVRPRQVFILFAVFHGAHQ